MELSNGKKYCNPDISLVHCVLRLSSSLEISTTPDAGSVVLLECCRSRKRSCWYACACVHCVREEVQYVTNMRKPCAGLKLVIQRASRAQKHGKSAGVWESAVLMVLRDRVFNVVTDCNHFWAYFFFFATQACGWKHCCSCPGNPDWHVGSAICSFLHSELLQGRRG